MDLVLAGHTHGGQMRIPIIGEVYDPEFGYFPGKISGYFEDNDTVIIVSRGLGNSNKRFQRINNFPEIITIKDTDD